MATKTEPRRYPVVPVLVGGVVVIAIAAVLAITLSGGNKASDGGVAQTRPVTVRGTALPEFNDTATDPAVGTQAPSLVGQDFSGRRVTITNDGHPKMVLFVAHW